MVFLPGLVSSFLLPLSLFCLSYRRYTDRHSKRAHSFGVHDAPVFLFHLSFSCFPFDSSLPERTTRPSLPSLNAQHQRDVLIPLARISGADKGRFLAGDDAFAVLLSRPSRLFPFRKPRDGDTLFLMALGNQAIDSECDDVILAALRRACILGIIIKAKGLGCIEMDHHFYRS